MTTTPWHLDDTLAERYADGTLGTVLTASVEQHLTACADCRALLTPHVDAPRLDAVWADVLERVEQPHRSWLERILCRAGMDHATARLVAAAPSLRGAWVMGTTLVLALALVAGYVATNGVGLYLALAPLMPMLGVALAYGPMSDPAHELAVATPYSQLRLLALRTAFVVTTTLVPAAVAGLLLPGSPYLAVVWLLPALALTVGTVALSTRVAPHLAAVALGIAWLTVSLRALAPRRDPLLATSSPVLLTCTVVLVVAAAFLYARRRDLAELLRRTA
ncbi:MAG TPA: zf-HC2 domain-containing protein [Nocardioides sp.]|nr:zf-HC2 domain-containing protein [Nocardioides sp.]